MPQNWWVPDQPANNFPGGVTYGGGGWNVAGKTSGAVQYRTPLDALRAAKGSIPSAEYPDGYLGTIIDRQQDKLLEQVQEKLTQRSYQRGVHKGEKIAGSDYLWNSSIIDPDDSLRREARTAKRTGSTISVKRYAPKGNPVERLAHMGKTAGLSSPEQMDMAKRYGVSVAMNPVVNQDPGRKERMQKMLPPWARTM